MISHFTGEEEARHRELEYSGLACDEAGISLQLDVSFQSFSCFMEFCFLERLLLSFLISIVYPFVIFLPSHSKLYVERLLTLLGAGD